MMNDEQLVKGCVSGNAIAQRELYNRFSPRMMGLCLRYARNEEEAQDILQDGFVKVFEKLPSFKSEGVLEGWVRKIMVNTALDYIRKAKLDRNNVDFVAVDYKVGNNAYVLESMAAEDLLEMLQQLPASYRLAFNLYAIEGYSHKEIADMLGISIGSSKSQYARAKEHLRKLIIQSEKAYK